MAAFKKTVAVFRCNISLRYMDHCLLYLSFTAVLISP